MQPCEKATLGLRLVPPSDAEPDGTLVLALINAVRECTDPDTHTVNMDFAAANTALAKLVDLMVTWDRMRQDQQKRAAARRRAVMN